MKEQEKRRVAIKPARGAILQLGCMQPPKWNVLHCSGSDLGAAVEFTDVLLSTNMQQQEPAELCSLTHCTTSAAHSHSLFSRSVIRQRSQDTQLQ